MKRPRRLLVEALEPRQLLSAGMTAAKKTPVVPVGSTFATAVPITLSSSGSFSQAYQIKKVGDVEFFKFTSPVTAASPTTNARLVIREVPGPGSIFPAVLSVYDSTQKLLPSCYIDPRYPNPSASLTSRVVIPVTQKGLYYVEAAAYPGCSGKYQLQIGVDDVTDVMPGSTSAGPNAPPPTAVSLVAGAGTQTGTINYPGDVDVFSYTATTSGNMTVSEKPWAAQGSSSGLSGAVSVFDAKGNQISPVAGMPVSQSSETVSVLQGTTYYIRAAGFGNSLGGYMLHFSTLAAPADNTFATANPLVITPDPTNAGTLTKVCGSIDYLGDMDYYQFVAPVTGQMTVREMADTSKASTLGSYLFIYDGNQNLIWKNNGSGLLPNGQLSKDALVTFNVTAGMTYYAEAAAQQGSMGPYVLQCSTYCAPVPGYSSSEPVDDCYPYPDSTQPYDFTKAAPIVPAADGSGAQNGRIDYVGDVDMYSFVATMTGPMNIRQTAGWNLLAPQVSVYQLPTGNTLGTLLTTVSAGLGSCSTAAVNVVKGKTYVIEAAANGTVGPSAGPYSLQFYYNVPYFLGLKDPGLITLVESLENRDGMINRVDMIQILLSTVCPVLMTDYNPSPALTAQSMIKIVDTDINSSPGNVNAISAIDLGDLRTILNSSAQLKMPGYVQVLGQDVVFGNPGNAVASYPVMPAEVATDPTIPQAYQGLEVGNLGVGGPAIQMETLVANWFVGIDRPSPQFHPLDDYSAAATFSAVYSSQPAVGPLYSATGYPVNPEAATPAVPPNTPAYQDMYQGYLGDCYFISSLGAIAKTNPQAIENMFIDNRDGTYTVRFYDGGAPDYVTVDRYLAVDPGTLFVGKGLLVFDGIGNDPAAAKTVLWIPLLEKAYTQWNAEGYEGHGIMTDGNNVSLNHDGVNVYWGIGDGGWADLVCTQVLGNTAAGYHNWPLDGNDEANLINAIRSNKAVTLGTIPDFFITNSAIAGSHEYCALGYNPGSPTPFELYNPWGTDVTGQPGTDPNIALSWADIQANFDYYSIADDSVTVPISGPLAQSKIVSPLPGPRPVDHLAGLWSLSSSASATSAAATPAPQEHARLVDLALLNY